MKLKQRIILGFLMIILVPMLLLAAALYGFSEAQHRNSARNDTIQEQDMTLRSEKQMAVIWECGS